MRAAAKNRRIELGRHIVADPAICGGQPTFKGTRIMVWLVLEQLERGLTKNPVTGSSRASLQGPVWHSLYLSCTKRALTPHSGGQASALHISH
jgi:hypothetical protein